MASIANRSRTEIRVKQRPDLTRFFPHDKPNEAQRYVTELRVKGLKPIISILDEAYLVRFRINGKRKSFTASSEAEALATKQRIESEQHHGLFVDYTKAHQVKFAELLIRYLRDEAPRTKGFLVTAYQINKLLEDAGLPRQDIVAIHAAHRTPKNPTLNIPRPAGRRMSEPSETARFILKPFATLEPEDFREYIDERLQVVEPATVVRELDLLQIICNKAMSAWRIHIQMHPMHGLERPKYFNERNRRLRGDEEARLLAAAHEEDRKWSRKAFGAQLFEQALPTTKYQRLKSHKEAGEALNRDEGLLIPMMSTWIQFQLMTGARKSESLTLTWSNLNLSAQTATLPETKNGRARDLPLRSDLVELLQQLPHTEERVFPISLDYLRKAWKRICSAAHISTEGDSGLRIHDLRHEAISRTAEAGSRLPGGFSLLDLQAFSGHRDPRMLMRYTHLTPSGLAKRLDAAFSQPESVTYHHGRRRLTRAAALPMSEIISTPLAQDERRPTNVVSLAMYRKVAA